MTGTQTGENLGGGHRVFEAHERLQAKLREIREAKNREAQAARHSGGH